MKSYNRYLPSSPIIENDDFAIFAHENLKPIVEELLEKITIEKQRILQFFGFRDYNKIEINLFDRQEEYLNYARQFYDPPHYDKGNFANGAISHVYDPKNIDTDILKVNLMHEFSHICYSKIWRSLYDRIIWLDEGLAQNLSQEKRDLEENGELFKRWYNTRIVDEKRTIPDITFLSRHGTKYGEFVDGETHRYSGYEISYLLIRYLRDIQTDIKNLLYDVATIRELEQHIIKDCIAYYNKVFDIEKSPQFAEVRPSKSI